MATRKEMALINAARAGDVQAQITLGKQYLSGEVGLSKNLTSAYYWLDRAAQQGEADAWMLIGSHIPFDIVSRAPQSSNACRWYEKAFKDGVVQAAVVFAKLVFAQDCNTIDSASRYNAFNALECAARAGLVEAQLLLMQQLDSTTAYFPSAQQSARKIETKELSEETVNKAALEWATRAAENGVLQAQRALALRAMTTGDEQTFLRWGLPVARSIVSSSMQPNDSLSGSEEDVLLVSRCAKALFNNGNFEPAELERFWTFAAQAGERDAQFALGLWLARTDAKGNWCTLAPKYSDYRQAVHWLTLAGEQGIADAWAVLAKVLRRPNAGQRSWEEIQHYVERAAEAGNCDAQLELGMRAWRARDHEESNDVRATYWLRSAAAQGNMDAVKLLRKIATIATPSPWAQRAQAQLTGDAIKNHPFLVARIELAALFGLSCPEALLLDVNTADRRHCLLVDIRAQYRRSTRRIILVQTMTERSTLSRIGRLFANIDCGPDGPEGDYQKRLYLFRKLVSLPETEGDAMFKAQVKPIELTSEL